jgi:hypothetical protein
MSKVQGAENKKITDRIRLMVQHKVCKKQRAELKAQKTG